MEYIVQSPVSKVAAGWEFREKPTADEYNDTVWFSGRAAEQRSEQCSSYQVIDQGKTMLMNTFSKPVQSIVPHNERPLHARLGCTDLSWLIT